MQYRSADRKHHTRLLNTFYPEVPRLQMASNIYQQHQKNILATTISSASTATFGSASVIYPMETTPATNNHRYRYITAAGARNRTGTIRSTTKEHFDGLPLRGVPNGAVKCASHPNVVAKTIVLDVPRTVSKSSIIE
ncbi:hypothetical protein BDB00DRAFT_880427 [Zychaea mexicana]|uniref:uncharacterized protein n=1 Tax=Zychaea mexicana TaxID=64656 RepID=UPI0022FE58D4|nr:uncharacterized protein BDB00DRAFT_880427 [Zychaea mexicana]KAI9467994.1 hypothetical protein BDB00DRAFT_880427 [Zychaea mexicana]